MIGAAGWHRKMRASSAGGEENDPLATSSWPTTEDCWSKTATGAGPNVIWPATPSTPLSRFWVYPSTTPCAKLPPPDPLNPPRASSCPPWPRQRRKPYDRSAAQHRVLAGLRRHRGAWTNFSPYDGSLAQPSTASAIRRQHGQNTSNLRPSSPTDQPGPTVTTSAWLFGHKTRCQRGYLEKTLRPQIGQKYRGRDAGCPAPPSQIPACSFLAPGSSRQLASHEHATTRGWAGTEAPQCGEAEWLSVGAGHQIRPMCSSAFGCAG